MAERADITELLNAAQSGDESAQAAAYASVYGELKRCAQRQRAQAQGSTLSPTELVSELFLRLTAANMKPVVNRSHFFALAARAMRQITIDSARRRASAKRGGGAAHVDVDAHADDAGAASALQALELDSALTRLTAHDADLARIVEWHFFAGLTFQNIADELGRHERTVRHDWELARAYLKTAMQADRVP